MMKRMNQKRQQLRTRVKEEQISSARHALHKSQRISLGLHVYFSLDTAEALNRQEGQEGREGQSEAAQQPKNTAVSA